MGALSEKLYSAGLVSAEKHAEQEAQARADDKRRQQEQLDAIEARRVEDLLSRLRRVTTLKRFRRIARELLLLKPGEVNEVARSVARLPEQKGLDDLQCSIYELQGLLPSLPKDEQEALIWETLG